MILGRMSDSFKQKVEQVKKRFSALDTPEKRYEVLMQMGRELPPFPAAWKTAERQVRGCQSTLYLGVEIKEGKIFFSAAADALISAGLAALLVTVYSGEAPEVVLTQSPLFLEELGIYASLSPNRSNGLSSIHLKMKREALQCLANKVNA